MVDSDTMRVIWKADYETNGGAGKYLRFLILAKLGRLNLARRIARFLYGRTVPAVHYRALFERYRPDLVFATDLQSIYDIRLLQMARARGVKTVGMVRSWDNLSSKGILPVFPDSFAVHTEEIKQELIRYNGVNPRQRNIFVIDGIPHYDTYLHTARAPRERFFRDLGLDPRKKLILFVPPADGLFVDPEANPFILGLLRQIPDAQILVRFPLVGSSSLEKIAPPPGVAFDKPRAPFRSLTRHTMELSKELDAHLADSLYWSDIVFSGPSSMAIDAAFFGKPIIFLGFDGPHEKFKRRKGVSLFLRYTHLASILGTGGVRVVRSPEELRAAVMAYLQDPRLDEEGRRAIVKSKVSAGGNAGAGERLAKYLVSHV